MKVELVTKTQGVGKYKELTSEEILSAIARHGVIKEDKGKLVRYLMDHKHWSPLQQVYFGFEIETSRAIARQILRHDLDVQEHSQRYSDRVLFEPIELRKEHPTNRQSSTEVFDPIIFEFDDFITDNTGVKGIPASFIVKEYLQDIERFYKKLVKAGVAKECARMILPECTTTTCTFNGSLRNWLTFLNVRCDKHSQKEIVEIATLIGEELESQLPNVFKQIDWRNGLFM